MKILQFLFVVLFSLTCISLSAQLTHKVGAGIQLSNLSGQHEGQHVTTFHGDLRLATRSNKKFQMEYGFSFNQKGSKSATETIPRIQEIDLIDPPVILSIESYIDNNIRFSNTKTLATLFELPIQANLFFTTPSEGLYAMASLRPSFVFHYQKKTSYFDADNSKLHSKINSVSKDQHPKNFNVISRLGMGYEIPTASSVHYFAEVFAETQLLDGDSTYSSEKNVYYYAFGALLGIRF